MILKSRNWYLVLLLAAISFWALFIHQGFLIICLIWFVYGICGVYSIFYQVNYHKQEEDKLINDIISDNVELTNTAIKNQFGNDKACDIIAQRSARRRQNYECKQKDINYVRENRLKTFRNNYINQVCSEELDLWYKAKKIYGKELMIEKPNTTNSVLKATNTSGQKFSEIELEVINNDLYWDADNYLVEIDKLPQLLLKEYNQIIYEISYMCKRITKPNGEYKRERLTYTEKIELINKWKEEILNKEEI